MFVVGILAALSAGCAAGPLANRISPAGRQTWTSPTKAPAGSILHDPFAKGRWTAQIYGSSVTGHQRGHIASGHAGVGYHFAGGASINIEGLLGGVSPRDDDDGVVGGFDLLFRIHLLRGRRWSFFLDAGAGFQQASTSFPDRSHHNFRPLGGLGFTVKLSPSVRLLGGARWLHISNAGTTNSNRGLDDIQIFTGLLIPF